MTAPVRVGVNLTWMVPGRVGGSEAYLVRQLLGLARLDDRFDVTIFCQQAFADAHPRFEQRFDTVSMPLARDWRGGRIAAEHSWLAARTRGFDIVHHGGGTAPALGPRPIVLTVHDLQYRRFPHYFSRARKAYLDTMMPRSARRAEVIATPSEYVRGTVIDAFGIDPDRVSVVPHGIVPAAEHEPAQAAAVRQRYGLAGVPYVIYPAITHPHKRHRLLVEMLAAGDRDLRLVLIGGAGHAEAELSAAIAASPVGRRVVRPGRVSDSERDILIAGAEALVFPSEYEGFGAPLIEAMHLDTPVVAGGHPALREVAGDAAIIVDGDGPTAWADAVTQARAQRDVLVAAGRARRGAFTAEVSGAALARVYRRAMGREVGP